MDAWNVKNSCLDCSKKNFEDTGLIIDVLRAYKSKGRKPPSPVEKPMRAYIKNLRDPKARLEYTKMNKKKKEAVTAKSKMSGFEASAEESAILATIANAKEFSDKKHAATSDLRKRANLADTGNGPPLNSSDQDLYDRQRATDKKSNEKINGRKVA